jgi:hypothetical protein
LQLALQKKVEGKGAEPVKLAIIEMLKLTFRTIMQGTFLILKQGYPLE